MKNMKYLVKLFMIALLIAAQSCSEDFLNEYPSNSQSPDNIQTIADAQIVMNGAYDLIQNNDYYNANVSPIMMSGLMTCRLLTRAGSMMSISTGILPRPILMQVHGRSLLQF